MPISGVFHWEVGVWMLVLLDRNAAPAKCGPLLPITGSWRWTRASLMLARVLTAVVAVNVTVY